MNITRNPLLDYPLIPKIIEVDKKKLQLYLDNPPTVEHGKAIGSNSVFPYQLRSFTVSGPNVVDRREWDEKVRYLKIKIDSELNLHSKLQVEIDTMIANIGDIRDNLIMEYVIQEKAQEWIARTL